MGMDHVEDDTLFEEAGTGSERDNMDMVKTTFFIICCILFINSFHSPSCSWNVVGCRQNTRLSATRTLCQERD
jgi:hypothetical protein